MTFITKDWSKKLVGFFLQAVLITHHQNREMALQIKNYLKTEQHIPEEFILIKDQINPCLEKNSFMHLCIDQNNELRILKLNNERVAEIFGRYKNKKGFN